MFEDNRKNMLYSYIEKKQYLYSSNELGSLLSVSSRTIRKEIKEMNDYEKYSGFVVLNKRNEGYYIKVTDSLMYDEFKEELFNDALYFDVNQMEGRIKQFILILLPKYSYVPIEEVAEQMYVSRTAIINDLNHVRELLASYNLMLTSKVGKGVLIEGTEKDKRYALASLINGKNINEDRIRLYFTWLDQNISLPQFTDQLSRLLRFYDFFLTDENLKNLCNHILIMLGRVHTGNTIEEQWSDPTLDEKIELRNAVENLIVDTFEVNVPKIEWDYLFILIKSKSKFKDNLEYHLKTNVDAYVDALLNAIRANYSYDLIRDCQLKHDLTSHINAMLYRVENQIKMRNPLEEHIKKYYPLAYEITLFAVSTIEKEFKINVNPGEIAYLALHIGASLERNYQIKYEHHNSCLIVCGSGFGTARMIEASIKNTIPGLFITKTISAQAYNQLDYIEEDLVISTVAIEKKNKPLFKIETLPSKKELLELGHRMTEEISQSVDIFNRFFSRSLFLKKNFKNKDEAIFELVNLLAKERIIENENTFRESVLKREELGSTAICEGVSIPHPLGLVANETKIAIGMIEQPIDWGNDRSVGLIFLLAISKSDYEEALNIYDFLVDVVRENHYDK